ncbi:hypothetical protein ACLOJK_021469 [Asimina triloba]
MEDMTGWSDHPHPQHSSERPPPTITSNGGPPSSLHPQGSMGECAKRLDSEREKKEDKGEKQLTFGFPEVDI